MKVIPAAQVKCDNAYIGQQRYEKMLEVAGYFSNYGKGIDSYCAGEGNSKSLLYFTKKITRIVAICVSVRWWPVRLNGIEHVMQDERGSFGVLKIFMVWLD